MARGPMLTWAAPTALIALAALPLLWLLLRRLPPPPRSVLLPSIKLLPSHLSLPRPRSRPPWWLLLLRLGAVALIIAGLAGPRVEQARDAIATDRLQIVIDNGWTSAVQWRTMQTAASRVISDLPETARVRLLPTAPPPGGWRTAGAETANPWQDKRSALRAVDALSPWPWPVDRSAVAATLQAQPVLWISDGLATTDDQPLRKRLRGARVQLLPARTPVLASVAVTPRGYVTHAVRPEDGPASADLRFVSQRQDTLYDARLSFAGDAADSVVRLDAAQRAQLARITLAGGATAASVFLADARMARPRAFIVDGSSGAPPPLESPSYYVRRALAPHSELASGTMEQAPRDPARLVILLDAPADAEQAAPLLRRVRDGAVVVSFAGPRIAENGSIVLPAAVARRVRTVGGALDWTQPLRVGHFARNAPLAGLPTASDARVMRQLLYRADSPPGVEIWAGLNDGTPLVSARRLGNGLLVFVHTAAAPGWSTLPLSGLFEPMLARLLPLALNPRAAAGTASAPFALVSMLRADASLVPPLRPVTLSPVALEQAQPSPHTPPGLYRSGSEVRTLNLAGNLGARFRFAPLDTTGLRVETSAPPRVDPGPWLIALGVLLLAADMVVALGLRGLLPAGLAAALIATPVRAQDANAGQLALAYVASGNATVDARTGQGIARLSEVLAQRTAIRTDGAVRVQPGRDRLGRYPIVYWPLTSSTVISSDAARALDLFRHRGGLLIIDPVGSARRPAELRRLLAPLALPLLAEVKPTHVLLKSFYLIEEARGVQGPVTLWAEADTDGDSGRVASIVLAGGDFATLWADEGGDAMQREHALRLGVNMVVYALTGTYKADQVHLKALRDRAPAQ